MADIVLGDLLRWQLGWSLLPATGEHSGESAQRVVSWAVAVRAASPILPPLRGGEIVVAPPRMLEQLTQHEGIDLITLLGVLANQPVSALLIGEGLVEEAIPGLPLLVSAALTSDTEATLNRLITERRSELYRLGSELTRALTTATLAGAGLDALLADAERVVGRDVLLIDADGVPLAGSTALTDRLALAHVDLRRAAGSREPLVATTTDDRAQWLLQRVPPPARQGRPADVSIVAVRVPADASTERERLALGQISGAVELLLGQARSTGYRERGHREALLAELLLGRLSTREAEEARARLLGIEPAGVIRVAVVTSRQPSLAARVHGALAEPRGRAIGALADDLVAIVLSGIDAAASDPPDLVTLLRQLRAGDPSLVVAISATASGVQQSPGALAQARVLARLIENGAVPGPLARADDPLRAGIFALLLPLGAGDLALRDRLAAFVDALLGPLEEQDARRGSTLVATLDCWLAEGGALAQAADRLAIHRNTLTYRLGRIEDLTGRDLDRPRDRLLLQVALAARALLHALDERA